MNIRPILFNTEMVRAILDGRKTVTRRVVKPQPTNPRWNNVGWLGWDDGHGYRMKPPCVPGDVLWVRETWNHVKFGTGDWHYEYRADSDKWSNGSFAQWRPSIYMPKEAARIFLRVKHVRVDRLQDMDEDAAIAEGIADSPADTDSPLMRFSELWDKTIRREDLREFGYHANPWVWVITFERCEKPKGE